ncbi:GntR family transcriptional regulator [Paenibacillus sp. 1P07SE]|uniref:GntR family transcriptional regulator n=1 Tax=Paenibacillus sp. 1P07SE TaxID=3132209 RepID=UPI0039A630B1
MSAKEAPLPIQLSEYSREPIYHQIEQQLAAFIVSGHLKAGTPLPSIRALAGELSCSVITVSRAYQNLEQRKLIQSAQGKGTFVAEVQAEEKRQVAEDGLEQAFRAAIEMSRRLGNGDERTREVFESVMMDRKQERGDQS